MKLPLAGLALCCATSLAACGDANILPPATIPTYEDTLTLFAVTGTDVAGASAFNLVNQIVARTDRTADFDFAFDMRTDSTGDTVAVLLPRGAVGLSADAGVLRLVADYDTLSMAPQDGYEFSKPVVFGAGDVIVVRSRLQTCNFGLQYGLYAKAQPLAISLTQRWVKMRMRVDANCGYRGLAPGIPSR